MIQNASFLFLDGARMGSILDEARLRNAAHDSLYRGGSSERLSAVAPYLFQFAYQTPFANWYLKTGWGLSWGLLIRSSYPMSEVHKHFRKFLIVKSESGQELYFRFYDPRVLRIFLPTCSPDQVREFFGGVVDYFIAEDNDPAFALRFRHENGELKTDRLPVSELIETLPAPQALPGKENEDELPPETIEALRAEGKLEEVMAAMGATKPAGQTKPAQPTTRPAVAAPQGRQPQSQPTPTQQQKPVDPDEAPAPKKSRWNMFE